MPLIGTVALAALQAMNLSVGARVLINNPKGAVGSVATTLVPLLGLTLATPTDVNVDGALDVRGNEHAHQAFAAVKDGGAYVTIVPEWWKPAGVFTAARGITPVTVANPANREVLEPLAAWMEQGALKPHIAEILSLDQIAEAHRTLETPEHIGKIVLSHVR